MTQKTSTLPEWLTKEYPFAQNDHLVGDGVKMNYVDHGEGEPVLLLHGNPTWSYFYRNLIKDLSSRGFRCIAPDHVGCGLSDKPQQYNYELEQHINNVESLVGKLGLEDVHLIIHDWGGAIGYGWAVKVPEKVRSVTVLNTAAFLSKRIPLRIALCKLPGMGEFLVRQFNAFAGLAKDMAVEKPLSPDVAKGFLYPYNNYHNRIATARFVKDIPMRPNHPSWMTLREIEDKLLSLSAKPMQICWGMKDWCFSHHFLDRWKELFPKASILELQNAGHYLLEDETEEVTQQVRTFLEDVRSD